VSHGGLAVGFVVALLTLFQARSSLSWLFGFLFLVVVAGEVYVVLRIVWYGSLSGIVTNCSANEFFDFVRDHKQHNWLPHTQVSNFVIDHLRESIRTQKSQKWRILYAVLWVRLALSFGVAALVVLMTLFLM